MGDLPKKTLGYKTSRTQSVGLHGFGRDNTVAKSMNARSDGIPNFVRFRVASVLLLVSVLVGVLAVNPDSVRPASDFPLHASVPSAAAPEIVSNRTVAARGDAVGFTVWLNLTGGGSIQYTWLNLTFDRDLAADAGNATTPSGCTRGAGAEWQCNGLRAGSHVWSIAAVVSRTADFGRIANVTASVLTYTNGRFTTELRNGVSAWIAGVILDFTVTSDPSSTIRLGERAHFVVIVRNDKEKNRDNESAYNITLHVDVSAWLDPGEPIDYEAADLTNGSDITITIDAVVLENATVGDSVGIRVTLTYTDLTNYSIGPAVKAWSLLVQPREIVSPTNLLAGILVGLAAILAAIASLLFVGQRRIRIDEVFLVHSSGALIHHVSRTAAVKKDDDLMAAMLVAVQAFVRDSLKREDTLDEFAFGPRKAAIIRGKDVVLAAILSGGSPAYLLPQLRAAVHAIEQVHGRVLANWDGRLSRLDQAPAILERLMRGGYRKETWTGWVEEAKGVFHRGR